MGKKKRTHPDIEEILARPWCYYCERDFDDLKILISHQKAKHFKCDHCGRRLNTAGGLNVHMSQVHKEALMLVHNAIPGRGNIEIEIFGMEGMPEDAKATHDARLMNQFQQAEASRRAQSNTPSGPKKPRPVETADELKRRLAEHRAKLEAHGTPSETPDRTPAERTPAESVEPEPVQPYNGQYQSYAAPVQSQQYPNPQFQNAQFAGPQFSPQFQFANQQFQSQYNQYVNPYGSQQFASSQFAGQSGYASPQQQSPYGQPLPGLPPRPNAGLPQRPSVPAEAQPVHTAPVELQPASVEVQPVSAPAVSVPAPEEKKKNVRLVYADETLSPEEKRAMLPRYAFSV